MYKFNFYVIKSKIFVCNFFYYNYFLQYILNFYIHIYLLQKKYIFKKMLKNIIYQKLFYSFQLIFNFTLNQFI